MIAHPVRESLQQIQRAMRAIGYVDTLLRTDYPFVDVLSSTDDLRTVALAVFAQEPPSYRTASFGVSLANGDGAVAAYRSLGAPQLFEIDATEVRRWKMSATGDPDLRERIPPDALFETITQRREQWGPEAFMRARAARFESQPVQLDFYDAGLVPTIEAHVRSRLDRLLREVLALCKSVYAERHVEPLPYPSLTRLVFRLLAAKLLADRGYPGDWLDPDPDAVLRQVDEHYFRTGDDQAVLDDAPTRHAAWDRIRRSFHLQNISLETLAYIYENTLVDPEQRQQYSIHSTPPEVAEYLVRQLPFDVIPEEDRHVFEPFSGHGALLIAALGRLRGLLPPRTTPVDRHRYLVRMLEGMEIDPFALEIARLSLMLADYPLANGWRLQTGDVFAPHALDKPLERARIVLCNPPFSNFTPAEQALYPHLAQVNKAAAILHRVLDRQPDLIGFVLPRAFPDAVAFREARRRLIATYGTIQLVALPDTAFAHSAVESVLLLASDRSDSRSNMVRLRTGAVRASDYDQFTRTGTLSEETEVTRPRAALRSAPRLWVSPLEPVWQALADYPRLGRIADIHRGIEYNVPVTKNRERLVARRPTPGFLQGLMQVADGFEPFAVTGCVYLNMDEKLMLYDAYRHPWNKPKVLANAARLSRGPWVITGVPDRTGLVASQNFHGLWPRADLNVEVLAAVVNGPVANAFLSERLTSRHNRIQTLNALPVPRFTPPQQEEIAALVRRYQDVRREWLAHQTRGAGDYERRCRETLDEIDAALLTAYDLHPRLERRLLAYFGTARRPGPVSFTGYYPPEVRSALPWRLQVSGTLRRAEAQNTLARLPILRDPLISEALHGLEIADD